jgi:hypothetical protein
VRRSREHVGDHEKARWVKLAHRDRSAGSHLVLTGQDFDRRGLGIDDGKRPVDARAQAAQHLVLGDRGEADQHDDAVAEQHRGAAFADAEGERDLGNEIAAFETGGVEPFAQQMDAGREAKAGHRGSHRRLRVIHERSINRFEV